MKKLSWTLVRKGDEYCAPACGGGCKYLDFSRLKKHAKTMCEELGDGWKIRMHHNVGWTARIKKGNTTIHYDEFRSHPKMKPIYSAWIEVDINGKCYQFIGDSKNLRMALKLSFAKARRCMDAIRKELYDLAFEVM